MTSTKDFMFVMLAVVVGVMLLAAFVVWDHNEDKRRHEAVAAIESARFSGPCLDDASLVATTAGSPNHFECWNRLHRMRVEAATKAGEEIGAVIHCECVRDTDGGER